MAGPGRPLPRADDASAPFWEACQRHELQIQRCAECGARRHPPRPMCPTCRSLASDYARCSGRGSVYSHVVCHPPVLPAFRDLVPYIVVVVSLDEAEEIRLVGNLIDCPVDALRIGLPVEVAFQELEEGVVLPQWRPSPTLGRPVGTG